MEAMTGLLQRMASFETRGKIDNRRRNFYVEKEFQKHFIFFFAGMILVLILASGVAFYNFFSNIIEQNMYAIHPKIQTVREAITPNLILFFVEVTLLALIIIFLTADRILNRTSKSLMKYEKLAEHLANLDLKRAGAVEIDSFQNLNKQYRMLVEKYSSDVILLKKNVVRMALLLDQLERYDDDADADDDRKLSTMTELIELKGAVAAKLAEYKTEKELDA